MFPFDWIHQIRRRRAMRKMYYHLGSVRLAHDAERLTLGPAWKVCGETADVGGRLVATVDQQLEKARPALFDRIFGSTTSPFAADCSQPDLFYNPVRLVLAVRNLP